MIFYGMEMEGDFSSSFAIMMGTAYFVYIVLDNIDGK
jgi:hypothetical protein